MTWGIKVNIPRQIALQTNSPLPHPLTSPSALQHRHNIFLVIALCNWQKRWGSGSAVPSQQIARAHWGSRWGNIRVWRDNPLSSKIGLEQAELGSHKATSVAGTTTFRCCFRTFLEKTQPGSLGRVGQLLAAGAFPGFFPVNGPLLPSNAKIWGPVSL